MRNRGQIDPTGRRVALALAAGRISIGAGALLATRPALRGLGFPDPGVPTQALGRLAGGRDIALGVLVFLGRSNRSALRTATLASACVDAVDALSLGLAVVRGDDTGPAIALGALSGAAAALGGVWAAQRITAPAGRHSKKQ
jgi:hypothetical protein